MRGVAPQTGGDPIGFLPEQALWLGADAQLSVAGTAVLRPVAGAPAGRETGTVHGGGTITLQANRGYVVAQSGSRMNLDGAAAAVDHPGLLAATTVARPAGTLKVSTPEGFALEGAVCLPVRRWMPQGRPLADGGRLDLSVGAGGVPTNTEAATRPYPRHGGRRQRRGDRRRAGQAAHPAAGWRGRHADRPPTRHRASICCRCWTTASAGRRPRC